VARDRAVVTQEELQSKIGEATNQRLYVLSIITAVFLPLGFVCSLLGVNVGSVPLQHDDWRSGRCAACSWWPAAGAR
jgi:zinc transporter